jgi:hypothetical protein
MNTQDRAAIEGIFGRLQEVERQGTPRDAEAEAFIRSRIDAQPSSAYYLAQTVAVQDDALKSAQQKITELEQKLAAAPVAQPQAQTQSSFGSGGSLSSFFGRNAGNTAAAAPSPAAQAPEPPPPPARPGMLGGGGFLAGAAQTAMGVAGGMMLGNMLGGLFGGHDKAAAAPTPTPAPAAEAATQPDHVADASNVSDTDSGNTDYDDGNLFDDGGGFDDV